MRLWLFLGESAGCYVCLVCCYFDDCLCIWLLLGLVVTTAILFVSLCGCFSGAVVVVVVYFDLGCAFVTWL